MIPFVFCGIIGATFGLAEVLSRYREPRHIFQVKSAYAYMGINAIGSVTALYFIHVFHVNFGSDKGSSQASIQVLLAGVGAMAFLRCSLFNLKLQDRNEVISFGPSMLLDRLLQVADRGVDRAQAAYRAEVIAPIMKDVSFEKAWKPLTEHCLELMQNVSKSEGEALMGEVRAIFEQEQKDVRRTLSLGLKLLNVVGERTLRTAVDSLGDSIKVDLGADVTARSID